ncbi:hypothetical protein PFICI_06317 [Pestalotiopsis fici W106-1]|uniref:DUF6536 domain-containing protein n=1 Tax=Pestalotiopsis fici (strain W106-1 / CGMCC3.15140) TaxID=1229662 RepID=W3X5J1_PESFW|nr:uncharacterized protein PFICI_06317 [Pestalotiopsis fici W106-1]ETS81315.1 hypothetical protein PFICI_06317 [Pestalotiopsis fici W106-1]
MPIWKGFPPRLGDLNWRQATAINTTITSIAAVIFVPLLLAAWTKAGGIDKTLMFFSGGCDTGSASRLNVVLHLGINIFSTALLASSNFFMQILNAPSREEVVKAHGLGSWLDIGVLSSRNAFRVSRFKTASWIIFFLSSLPIHLLFNSAIFQTDNRGAFYHLTIANEAFIHGGQYFGPGASLTMPSGDLDAKIDWLVWDYPQVSMDDYRDPKSAISANISLAAAHAAGWNKVSAAECRDTYSVNGCSGIRTNRDLVVVIDKAEGWETGAIFDMSFNEVESWNSIVPPNQTNNLWFSTRCLMGADLAGGTLACHNACNNSLSFAPEDTGDSYNITFLPRLTFQNTSIYRGLHLDPLPVRYCLQEAFETECQLGLSITLLFAVTFCILVKLLQCLIVIKYLDTSESLVTLGDAVAAFIARPDPYTAGYCTMQRRDAAQWEIQESHEKWQRTSRRVGSTLSSMHWLVTYAVFFICASTAVAFLIVMTNKHLGLQGTITPSDSNPLLSTSVAKSFLSGVLAVNSPQLMLSFCYVLYNNLFTKMQMGREWAALSRSYKGLRVSDPRGHQYATYRLQLPYRYSIALIIGSMILHWMLSNTFYIVIVQGDYFNPIKSISIHDDSVGPERSIAFGYSSTTLLVCLVIFIASILVPIVVALSRLPGNTTVVGSESLAISAACHVSTKSKTKQGLSYENGPWEVLNGSMENIESARQSLIPTTCGTADMEPGYEMVMMDSADCTADAESQRMHLEGHARLPAQETNHWMAKSLEDQQRLLISQGRIKWGEVTMPVEWYAHYEELPEPVRHLSFGLEGDEVQEPEDGQWYA